VEFYQRIKVELARVFTSIVSKSVLIEAQSLKRLEASCQRAHKLVLRCLESMSFLCFKGIDTRPTVCVVNVHLGKQTVLK